MTHAKKNKSSDIDKKISLDKELKSQKSTNSNFNKLRQSNKTKNKSRKNINTKKNVLYEKSKNQAQQNQEQENYLHDSAIQTYDYITDWSSYDQSRIQDCLAGYDYSETKRSIQITRFICLSFIIFFTTMIFFRNCILCNTIFVILIQFLYSIMIFFKNYLFFFYNSVEHENPHNTLSSVKQSSIQQNYNSKLKDIKYEDLPVYCVILPLLNEANIVDNLIYNISLLHYPSSKLQVLLVLEENDIETISAAKNAINIFKLNAQMIIVPNFSPQTKAKACNYALQYVKADYLVIFDSEDQPDSDQLLKAAHKFINNSEIKCLQASLSYYNKNYNFLTKMFTIEYGILFHILLPALQKNNMPIPLGGSSSHFCVKTLRRLKGWDLYNVTEDAELGIRMASLGYKVEMLNSYTFEESPVFLMQWLKQRARWIKGHIKTYIHYLFFLSDIQSSTSVCKNDISYIKSNIKNFQSKICIKQQNFTFFSKVGVHCMIGLPYIAMLFTPLLLIYILCSYLNFSLFLPQCEKFIYLLSYVNLGSYLVTTLMQSKYIEQKISAIDIKSKSYKKIQWYLFPFYNTFHIIASFMAIYQLIIKPYYWDKTPHGLWLKSEEEKCKNSLKVN